MTFCFVWDWRPFKLDPQNLKEKQSSKRNASKAKIIEANLDAGWEYDGDGN